MSDQDFRDMTYWKATRLNGTDFHTGTVDYAAALASGEPVTAPVVGLDDHRFPGPKWLHLATVPTECVGMSWPCRLFEVEPADDLGGVRPRGAYKVGATSVRVLREIDAHVALGPQGVQVAALIERCATLTEDDMARLGAARGAAWGAAWGAARDAVATRGTAWGATRDATRGTTWGAACALLARDLIGQAPGWDQAAYDLLTGLWRQVIGPIHPDDAPMDRFVVNTWQPGGTVTIDGFEYEIDTVDLAADFVDGKVILTTSVRTRPAQTTVRIELVSEVEGVCVR